MSSPQDNNNYPGDLPPTHDFPKLEAPLAPIVIRGEGKGLPVPELPCKKIANRAPSSDNMTVVPPFINPIPVGQTCETKNIEAPSVTVLLNAEAIIGELTNRTKPAICAKTVTSNSTSGPTGPSIFSGASNEPVLKKDSPVDKPRRNCSQWCAKYFCAGQIKEDSERDIEDPPPGSSWFYANFIWRRPKAVTVWLPFVFVFTGWLTFMLRTNSFSFYSEGIGASGTEGWKLFLMMVFGSFVAGATSEGGGSVAFPVMTLVLGIAPDIARDFSLMIQSIGMTAAMFGIFYARIAIDWLAFKFATAGGTVGIIIGLQFIAPNLPGDVTKMLFVSVFFAFAIHLFILNRQKKRITHLKIQEPEGTKWVKALLLLQGFFGGILSALAGSGIDICTFTLLVLGFRITEKIGTPTSVCLMAINTCIGFFWRGAVMQEIEEETFQFWICAVPAVVVGAPIGAFVSSYLHRQVLACAVYFTDVCQFVAAPIIVPQTPVTIGITLGSFVFANFGFWSMSRFGQRYANKKEFTYGTSAAKMKMKEMKEVIV